MCRFVQDADAPILRATPSCAAFRSLVKTGARKLGFHDKRAWLMPATLDLALIGQFPAALIEQVEGLIDTNDG